MTFQHQIKQGIPAELPAPKPYPADANRAPKRKDILTKAEKQLAVRNALRYFPKAWHGELAVEFAKKFGVKFEVRNSMNANPGTLVTEEDMSMESVVIRGVSLEKDQAKITITAIPEPSTYLAAIGLLAGRFAAAERLGEALRGAPGQSRSGAQHVAGQAAGVSSDTPPM